MRSGLRCLLCSNQNDWQRFDDLFDEFWLPVSRHTLSTESVAGAPVGKRQSIDKQSDVTKGLASDADQTGQGEDENTGEGGAIEGATSQESLLSADFQFITDAKQMSEVDEFCLLYTSPSPRDRG